MITKDIGIDRIYLPKFQGNIIDIDYITPV